MFQKKYLSIIAKGLKAIKLSFLIILALIVVQCSKDSEAPAIPTGRTKTYTIRNTDLSDITGSVTFIENDNNSTTIDISLFNTAVGVDNVIDLRRETANIGGGIAANLNPLNGSTGASSTLISKLNDGQKITYDQLLGFSGYIAIGVSNQNTGELAAFSDIGPNEPTGKKVTYALFSPLDDTQNGLAIFEERKKGTSSVTVNFFDFESNGSYPVYIKDAEINSSNAILIEISPVKGKLNGNSFSELSEINGATITFEDLLQLNATLEVYSDLDSDLVEASGGIGSNPKAQID